MRLDPKYFTVFIALCALLTLIVIVYGSISYYHKQEQTLRSNIERIDFSTRLLPYVESTDTLQLGSLHGDPVVIHFWATWSNRSAELQHTLGQLQERFPRLVVVAAAVRDDERLIREYVEESPYAFVWVLGTELYQELQVPGVPSQILLDGNGAFHGVLVGDDAEKLAERIRILVDYE